MHTNSVRKKISLIGPIIKIIASPVFKNMIHTGRPYQAGRILLGLFTECGDQSLGTTCPEKFAHWRVGTSTSCGSDTVLGASQKSLNPHAGHAALSVLLTSCALESGDQGGSAVNLQVQVGRQGSEPR